MVSDDEWTCVLGPVVLNCRPKPLHDLTVRPTAHPSERYVLLFGKVLGGGFVLCLLLAILMQALALPRETTLLLFGPLLVFCSLLVYWVYRSLRGGDYLILHRHGFRCRILFRAVAVAFEDLAEFRCGRDVPALEKVARAVGQVRFPELPTLAALADRKCVTLVRKDGSRQVVRGLLLRFDEADTLSFLGHLHDNYPGLLGNGR
jgi:hypothetical protein